ncbi:hypothetical protein [Streptococcus pneumoniae]|uniref:hypothetical protein n=1 Tax=Streptococcus pneumoniae TaxID=1313 RepID=UPI00067DE3A4|nr:hypothetical protein [Streptococcus pneumoniae]
MDETDEVSNHTYGKAKLMRFEEIFDSKHCFEVADRTDEISNYTYGKVKLTWFEEILEEY